MGPRDFFDRFVARMENAPRRIALVRGETRLSYAELINHAVRKETVSPQRVALNESDPLALFLDMLACWRSGAVPVLPRLGSTELSVVPGDDRESLILTTSGTANQPKFVALPASSLLANAETIARDLVFRPEDRILVCTPLTYMYGLMGSLLAGLWSGAEVNIFPPTTVPSILQAHIRKAGVTVIQGPPSTHRLHRSYWNNRPFNGVRLVTQGGEICGRSLADWFTVAYPRAQRVQVYGMTEAGPRISHLDMGDPRTARGGVGCPFPHLNWCIDRKPDAPNSAPGRLRLAGATVMLGYPNSKGSYDGLDTDGYFSSNDLVSEDVEGCLFFEDRLDRCFKSGGRLVNPGSVERILMDQPGVQDSVCFPAPHEILGHVAQVRILPEAGYTLTEQEVRNACANLLEPFEIPRRVFFVEEFPLGASGKRSRVR